MALVSISQALKSMGSSAGAGRDGDGDGDASSAGAVQGVEAAAHSGGLALSARQLLRIARRAEASVPAEGDEMAMAQLLAVVDGVRRSVVAGLMSPALSMELEQRINEAMPAAEGGQAADGIMTHELAKAMSRESARDVTIELDETARSLVIGRAQLPLSVPSRPELVPEITFTDNAAHLRMLESMALDLASGERALLLIGSQGTGKNKLADRLLQLSRREREYMQLHRDTTVQSLTVEPTLVDGSIQWRPSPLVEAVTNGHVLVLDEADKAVS